MLIRIVALRLKMLRNLFKKHKELKKRIHNFRIPLSSTGQKIVGVVYFTVPLIGGYYLFQYTNVKSEQKWGKIIKRLEHEQKHLRLHDSVNQRMALDFDARQDEK